MINQIFLEHLAQSHHQELLQEAQCWRETSLAMGKQPAKVGLIRRIRTQIGKLAIAPANISNASLTHES
jgi:hypothetical protein